jgi:hypothetical protein
MRREITFWLAVSAACLVSALLIGLHWTENHEPPPPAEQTSFRACMEYGFVYGNLTDSELRAECLEQVVGP